MLGVPTFLKFRWRSLFQEYLTMLPEFDSGRRTPMKDRSHELEFLEPKLPEGRSPDCGRRCGGVATCRVLTSAARAPCVPHCGISADLAEFGERDHKVYCEV